jgi:hypothetical protein
MPGRFDYVKYDSRATEDQARFKAQFEELEHAVTANLKPGRASSLVLTKLEEAYMWVGKAIRDEQIVRTGEAQLQESRGDA